MSNEKPDTSIYNEYFRYIKEYTSQYGSKTIVLLLVGSFFEIYGIKNADNGEITESRICDISEICQLNISEKKPPIVMAGFRDYSLDKYLVKLMDAGFTVPVFIQDKSGKTIIRKLDRIYSPGTYISYETESSPKMMNNIMCIWVECFKPLRSNVRETMVYGFSVINIFTGKSNIFQHETPFYMNTTSFDELERYISVYEPCEVIIISGFNDKQVNTMIQFSGIRTNNIHRISIDNPKPQNCSSQKYIKQILGSLFGEETYDICLEFQHRNIATQAFCYLVDFIKEQNADLIRKISIPVFSNTSERMILANHTLLQLNIIDDTNNDAKKVGNLSSVLGLLNKCSSPMGKRKFQYQLTNPIFDTQWLNTEYYMTGLLIKTGLIGILRKHISQIRDLEKLYRQLIIRRLFPSSIFHLYTSIQKIGELNNILREHPEICEYLGSENPYEKTKQIYSMNMHIDTITNNIILFLNNHFIIDQCKSTSSMTTFDESIIQPGISKQLDDVVSKHTESEKAFHSIHRYLNEIIRKNDIGDNNGNTEYIKIHETEKSGVSLQITTKRSELLKSILEKQSESGSGILEITPSIRIQIKSIIFSKASTTNMEIRFPELEKICNSLLYLKDNINTIITSVYLDLLTKLETSHFNQLEELVKFVSKMDVLQCKAYIAEEYNYCSPIIDSDSEKPFIDAIDMRHCLIEHIQQNEIYVPNDIVLGVPTAPDGVLLYGTNAVGKTSFIRAIGICIVMAQAGLFVPCSRFRYKPYTAIFSRILGNDNIFKGLSTFAVEMSELRIILKMADQNSLILGDELCSGTEMESALSIFVCGLQRLHSKHSSFIFATHFHEIVDYDEIKELSKLALKHMEVTYNRELDVLEYDRKLRDGSGPRIYGLEVCKSLYMDDEFLEKAYAFRNKYYPETRGELSMKPTHYNINKIRSICEKCGEKIASETHHLAEQKMANSKGFIDSFHKDHPANLLSVCEDCHNKIHYGTGEMEIENVIPLKKIIRRKKTTKGFILA